MSKKLKFIMKVVFEIIWILSCVLVLVFAATGLRVAYQVALGSMWMSLFIKIALTISLRSGY